MSLEIINITEKAILKIRDIAQSEDDSTNKGLRVAVMGGGCSGFSYKIEFSKKKKVIIF